MPAHDVADPAFEPQRRANIENWEDRVPIHIGTDGMLAVELPPLGEYQLVDRPDRLVCTYTLQASKPS